MWPLVTYSNYFERVSTVTNQTHFQVAMFAFNTVLLYDYYYISSKNTFSVKKGMAK